MLPVKLSEVQWQVTEWSRRSAVSQGQQLGLTGHTGPYKTVADLLFPVDVKGGHIIPNAFRGIQCFQLAVVFIVGLSHLFIRHERKGMRELPRSGVRRTNP